MRNHLTRRTGLLRAVAVAALALVPVVALAAPSEAYGVNDSIYNCGSGRYGGYCHTGGVGIEWEDKYGRINTYPLNDGDSTPYDAIGFYVYDCYQIENNQTGSTFAPEHWYYFSGSNADVVLSQYYTGVGPGC